MNFRGTRDFMGFKRILGDKGIGIVRELIGFFRNFKGF